MDTSHARIERHTNNVKVVAGIGNKLFFGDASHRLNLVANTCSFFKLQILAGSFHTANQLRKHLIIFARQKQAHILDLLSVFFFTHQSFNARPQTTSYLILQTRTRAIAINTVFALANGENLLQ